MMSGRDTEEQNSSLKREQNIAGHRTSGEHTGSRQFADTRLWLFPGSGVDLPCFFAQPSQSDNQQLGLTKQ